MRPVASDRARLPRRIVPLALAVLAACAGASAAEDSARYAADTATIPGTLVAGEVRASLSDTGQQDSAAMRRGRGAVLLPSWAAEWQGDTAALHATTPWLGLVVDARGSRLAPVPVRRYAVEDVCFSQDTAKVWIDRLEPQGDGVVFAVWGESGLSAGRVTPGILLDNGAFGAFSDPNDGLRPAAGGVRAVFRDDTLRFREEPHHEGFRVIVRWRDADEVLYETESQDEGSWNVRWVGDLDHDDVPDILLDASWKYSVDVTWLHLSGGTSHGARWRAVGRYAHSAC